MHPYVSVPDHEVSATWLVCVTLIYRTWWSHVKVTDHAKWWVLKHTDIYSHNRQTKSTTHLLVIANNFRVVNLYMFYVLMENVIFLSDVSENNVEVYQLATFPGTFSKVTCTKVGRYCLFWFIWHIIWLEFILSSIFAFLIKNSCDIPSLWDDIVLHLEILKLIWNLLDAMS